MNSDDEDDVIESNSSENTPPLSYNRDALIDDTNENDYLNTNNRLSPAHHLRNDAASFDELFEKFIQANSSKTICKSFENITKLLNINTAQVFESGYTFPAPNQSNSSNNRLFSSDFYFQQQQKQQQQQNASTRMLYQIIKSKTNYWKANELWKKYDKRASLKDYLLTTKTSSSYKDLNVLIIGCGPVGLRLSIECALLGLKCTIVEKRDR